MKKVTSFERELLRMAANKLLTTPSPIPSNKETVVHNKEIVAPSYVSGMNYSWNLNIFSGPKFYIVCGECGCGFYARLPRFNYPVIACPNCCVGNEIPIEYR